MKLLITGAIQYNEKHIADIQSMGHSVIWMQNEKDPLPTSYENVEGVICNGLFLHHPIEKFINLKYIQLTSAGLDRVPLEYIKAKGITIHNARGVYSIPMAEFALSSVLSIYKQHDYFRVAQSDHRWNKHRGLRELYEKRICILGCGDIGTECAKRFSAMGCEIIGVDIVAEVKQYYNRIMPIAELHNALTCADVLILTLPLTEKTKHILGGDELSLLLEGSIIVNISRGGVLNTDALMEVMQRRQDMTAVLDVFEDEPLPCSSPLWDLSNVIISPHNSFVGEGNVDRLWKTVQSNLFNAANQHLI